MITSNLKLFKTQEIIFKIGIKLSKYRNNNKNYGNILNNNNCILKNISNLKNLSIKNFSINSYLNLIKTLLFLKLYNKNNSFIHRGFKKIILVFWVVLLLWIIRSINLSLIINHGNKNLKIKLLILPKIPIFNPKEKVVLDIGLYNKIFLLFCSKVKRSLLNPAKR